MTNAEWVEMLNVIPTEQQNQIVLVLHNGCEVMVETIARIEANFLVIRGRVGGTIEEGRGFFLPFSQMLYMRLEREVKISELKAMFGESFADRKSALDEPETEVVIEEVLASTEPTPVAPAGGKRPPVPAAGDDPSAIARTLLMERIRAGRNAISRTENK